jgi:hypothetical protein
LIKSLRASRVSVLSHILLYKIVVCSYRTQSVFQIESFAGILNQNCCKSFAKYKAWFATGIELKILISCLSVKTQE